jgi:hypothetical protein
MWDTGSASTRREYDPNRHYVILATTLMEAVLLAGHAFDSAYRRRPDVEDVRNNMRARMEVEEMQRQGYIDKDGDGRIRTNAEMLANPNYDTEGMRKKVKVDTGFSGGPTATVANRKKGKGKK